MPQTDELQIVLHIGGSKCGSSAIQAYLQQNEAALSKAGNFQDVCVSNLDSCSLNEGCSHSQQTIGLG